ncbi:hypothetical protein C1645_832056 [Glomus cerebriforme]|uniref:Uncharacterized protein n=1 Tax=Glomus cerebriforme TaxID=658196 RepID=A0A397SEA7_9GLOM|nr:hypothetical protein C1645_832056 [Glomus cerebriforme]
MFIASIIGDRKISQVNDDDFIKIGTPVYNMPVEYEDFPLLIDYGTFKPSSYEAYHRSQQEPV